MGGILIDRTSSPEWSHIHYALIPLFDYPREQMGFRWSGMMALGQNTDSTFPAAFVMQSRSVINGLLRPTQTVADFVARIDGSIPEPRWPLGAQRLPTYEREHCVILAALGRLEDAAIILQRMAAQEGEYRRILAKGEAELTRRPRSSSVKLDVDWATVQLDAIGHLMDLMRLVEAENRSGIASLLRSWERHNAKFWGVEHLWEPTPFPVEEMA